MTQIRIGRAINKAASISCEDCWLFESCLPAALEADDVGALDTIIERGPLLRRGEPLFQAGDRFRAVSILRSGSAKTLTGPQYASAQITGFHLAGELLGLDAINSGYHPCSAVALETTAVCIIPFPRLEALSEQVSGLYRRLLKLMSRQFFYEEMLRALSGKKSGQARLAAFLLNLSERYAERGLSGSELHLHMSRDDIGNYLGLATETVSRTFTRMQAEGLLEVEGKLVRIPSLARLRGVGGEEAAEVGG